MALAQVVGQERRLAWGALGSVLFLAALAVIDPLTRGAVQLPALVPPFGASVAIVFFAPESPMGRPWNVLFGHAVSALAASMILAMLPGASLSVLSALAVPAAVLAMVVSRSFHPPGGATALLAVVTQPRLGFAMLVCPVLIGAALLVLIRLGLDALVRRSSVRAHSSR